ncbi:unnamed protein product [Parnassius mnemosyne]|uniref:Uncharacterized protein n=1 Tax=Parnassius mnemosyne TaxID=213953 RepID=A0AAV1LWP9_9NEOP
MIHMFVGLSFLLMDCWRDRDLFRFMNISFSHAVYCDTKGNEFSFENLFVQARNIRYVHIPENISILGNIKEAVKKDFKKKSFETSSVKKSRKAKKALKQHMQIVASLENTK